MRPSTLLAMKGKGRGMRRTARDGMVQWRTRCKPWKG